MNEEASNCPETDDHGGLPAWEWRFRLGSGRLCLVFCATVGERWRRNFDRLREPGDLGRWIEAAGLLDAAPVVDRTALDEARLLREAIYRLVLAAMADRPLPAADRDLLNRWARRPDLAPQLDRTGRALSRLAEPDGARRCLASVARDALDLLAGADRERIRECAADDCALLFVDRSRPGRRRWCSEICAGRTRSASYRRRQAQRGSP